ncbi:tRNA uridine(34) 5-carboxymethylaminomethyl modification radical SAM/GNAT enzyme Elp3 [Candidatus Woesearchaeota archaeon]|nr:tRNA uridine(34) 5-carboxymethylaminomethyl modification radical SAM/GNAT enzyme Elp3 [Candidatus Woesearchaeota archaeon]
MAVQDYFFGELIEYIKRNRPDKDQLMKEKVKLCSKYHIKDIPTDIRIYMNAMKEDAHIIRKYLITKPTRTISGVSVVAIMTKPAKCPHGRCIFCPGGTESFFGDVPQSYTGREPATMRAIRANFDPYLQVFNRLEQYVVLGQMPEKIELIVMGGTFPSMPIRYQDEFIAYAYKAMNDFSQVFGDRFDLERFKVFFELPADVNSPGRTLKIQEKILKMKGKAVLGKEQSRNERSAVRCVGLTIETRPDYGRLKHGNQMLKLGCTRVELGVQTTREKFLVSSERGHTLKDSVDSIRILKDLGFKLNFHFMLGLPGSDQGTDLEMLRELFSDPGFRPDMLKIYPCMVMPGTRLYDLYLAKKYKPITTGEAVDIIASFKGFVPEYCRIMRVQRDIPTNVTKAGVDRTNLRQYVVDEMKDRGTRCRCIRCREAGRAARIGRISIMSREYDSSGGKEFFISAEDKKNDVLVGFCRMRFPSGSERKEITKDAALIRELHVYGTQLRLGKRSGSSMQHKGYGQRLLRKAEDLAKRHGKKKIVVISGVGAREYYKKLGYRRQGPYMVRYIH